MPSVNTINPINSSNAASLAKMDEVSLKNALADPKGTSDPNVQANINKLLHNLMNEQAADKNIKLDKPIQTLVDMQKMIDEARPVQPRKSPPDYQTDVAPA
jgi:hypothetical protein